MTKKLNVCIATLLTLFASSLFAETYVNVYEMPYGEVDQNSKSPKELYNQTIKSAPVSSYKEGKGGKKESYMGARGVRVVFDDAKDAKNNFNGLLEIASRYAKTNLKSKNSAALSKMLIDLKEK